MELNVEVIRLAIVTGLPIRKRWTVDGTTLDFDFERAQHDLRKITPDDVVGGIEKEWLDLLIFGELDVCEGGGATAWIAIRSSDGAVCGLDVERRKGEEVFFYNSSIEKFIQTFTILDRSLSHDRPLPLDFEVVAEKIDPIGYRFSEWRSLIDYLKGM